MKAVYLCLEFIKLLIEVLKRFEVHRLWNFGKSQRQIILHTIHKFLLVF